VRSAKRPTLDVLWSRRYRRLRARRERMNMLAPFEGMVRLKRGSGRGWYIKYAFKLL
jgi:hypothetical protein